MIAGDPLPDTRPYTLAAAYLWHCKYAEVLWATDATGLERPTRTQPTKLRYWRDDFYEFQSHIFRPLVLEEVVSDLTCWLNGTNYFGERSVTRPLRVDASVVRNVLGQLRAICQARVAEMPNWIGGDGDGEGRPEPRAILAFSNGLVDLGAWLAETPVAGLNPLWWREPTADWFSTKAVPRPFDPTAICPETLRFFHRALVTQDQVDLLQEWCGYVISGDATWQKMLWLHGRGGAGKGTICRLLADLVGKSNTVTFSLSDLSEKFTLESWLGKSLAVCREARLGRGADAVRVVDQLLSISGEDERYVDRKNKAALPNHRFDTRIVVATNAFPDLPDAGEPMRRRSLILSFDASADRPDPQLYEKLVPELPGLTAWAMQGLRRLNERRRFTTPERMADLLDRLCTMSSPVGEFLEECCVAHPLTRDQDGRPRPRPRAHKRQVYAAWEAWRKANHVRELQPNTFAEKLYAAAPDVRSGKPRVKGGRSHTFEGLELLPAAFDKLSQTEKELSATMDD